MRSDRGSVFIESVIAAAIVATALGSTLEMIASTARRDHQAETRRTALQIAQSQLADVGADILLTPGATAGVAGDLVWRVEVSPYSAEGEANSVGGLWRIAVTVRPRAGGPNLASLASLRLGGEP